VVSDTSSPAADQVTFNDLGLSAGVLEAIKELGYESPSAIQAATIPLLLEGRDVVGLAQTGTGKTAAFALPVLSNLDPYETKKPQALVLAPTRELALQVCEAFEKYAAQLPNIRVLPVYGGQGYGPQLTALRRGVHVVVGTPGRIMDHLDKGTLDLSELKFLVLDEADEMLSMGFSEDIETILADTPDDKQVALFSATMPAAIKRLTGRYLNNPKEVQVKTKTATNANITQRYMTVAYPQKVDALTRILEVENFEGMIVFVRTKAETESLAEKLRARGFTAAAISGDVAQNVRERTVNQLKDGSLDILVATDVAARGLDVERISHVVNYDIPTDPEAYVHRIGRTGRAGRTGDAISFITPRERYLLKLIEKTTRSPLQEMKLPSADEVNATRLSRFDDGITAALAEAGRVEFFRDVVAHYVKEYDVPEIDVAAALAVVLQGDEPLLIDPAADRARNERSQRERTERNDRGDRAPRESSRSRQTDQPLATYRINVGKRHKVEPRQIVGAIANEGGLRRGDFGNISIRPDFSLVELPADLAPETWAALENTRISGKLIELKVDNGGPVQRSGGRFDRNERGPRHDDGDKARERKPRRKY
jgi:ATP-dependent RNA helicase DeaD